MKDEQESAIFAMSRYNRERISIKEQVHQGFLNKALLILKGYVV